MKTKKAKKKLTTKQRVKKLLQNFSTLELFLQALTQLYPLDKMTPGINLAYLPNGNFYASVSRYDVSGAASPTNPGAKQVLLSVQAPTLQETIINLAANWHESTRMAAAFARASAQIMNQMTRSIHETGVTVRGHGKKVRRG